MFHVFKIQNVFKMHVLVHIQLSSALLACLLLVMLLHHTPLAEKFMDSLFMSSCTRLSMFLDICFTFPTGIFNRVSFPLYQIFKICLPPGLLSNSLINDIFHLWIFSYRHLFNPLNFLLILFSSCFIFSVRICPYSLC
jgi:hypothetical protein